MTMLVFVTLSLMIAGCHSLNNGLALTPPMGFLSWERFRCNTDCKTDPDNCISENLYRSIADAMVSQGYKDLGYEYVNIDDCWLAKSRTADGKLQPDPERFPSGMKNLSQYVHSKGLKLGIYEDFGSKTCAGFPGSEFFMETDANTFAEWEIDLLKFDGCNSDPKDMNVGYPLMGFFLNQTGRPFLYSCSWPAYIVGSLKILPNYTAIRSACNIWRNYNDIQDSWDSVMSIVNYYAKNEGGFAQVAGPGGFNDPDELVIGDFGLSYNQQRAQFGMWAMLASPLFISADIRRMQPMYMAILQNKRVIAINQDPRGAQATQLWAVNNLQLWVKPLANKGSAFALLNADDQGTPRRVQLSLKDIGLTFQGGYNVTEAFEGMPIGLLKPSEAFNVTVNPTGILLAVAMEIS